MADRSSEAVLLNIFQPDCDAPRRLTFEDSLVVLGLAPDGCRAAHRVQRKR